MSPVEVAKQKLISALEAQTEVIDEEIGKLVKKKTKILNQIEVVQTHVK